MLNAQMAGIGMQFAVAPAEQPDIEKTLLWASDAGLVGDDLRVLSILVTWLEVHHAYINADRLIRMVNDHEAERVRSFWAAVGVLLGKDRRYRRLQKAYEGAQIDLLSTGTDFQIARHGKDRRFTDTALRVPSNVLRSRASDVLTPQALAAKHAGYRNRILIGPTWRADVWTELESDPTLSAADAARLIGCAFATAWHTKRDFDLLARAHARSDADAA